MTGPTPVPRSFTAGFTILFRCLTGLVVPAEQIGIIQRGTHRLLDANGRVIAALRSDVVNLNALVGQNAIVCGLDEGQIEGVTSLNVTQAFPIQFGTPLQLNISSFAQALQSISGGFGGGTWMP